MLPKFVQIVTGTWEQDDNEHGVRLQNILWALAEDGTVWKFVGSGWRQVPMIIAN